MRAQLLPVAFVLALAFPAGADHCTTYSTSFSIQVGPYHLDTSDLCGGPGCMWNVWIYEETNGLPGLQRNDIFVDDTCHGMFPSDTLVL